MVRAKILVIDDDFDIRHIAQVALTRLGGFEVLEADGALEGLRLAEQEHPDVILLDVMMPGMDGTAVLKMLQTSAATASIPVIFLTARATRGDEENLRGLGAMGLIPKPFDPMTLTEKVQ